MTTVEPRQVVESCFWISLSTTGPLVHVEPGFVKQSKMDQGVRSSTASQGAVSHVPCGCHEIPSPVATYEVMGRLKVKLRDPA